MQTFADFENYCKKLTIRDRAFYNTSTVSPTTSTNSDFLETTNNALNEVAMDLNSIDPSYYAETVGIVFSDNTPVNLTTLTGHRTMGVAGFVCEKGCQAPTVLRGEKRTGCGFAWWFDINGDTWVEKIVNNLSTSPFTGTVYVQYNRKPNVLTGSPIQLVDFPEVFWPELATYVEHLYHRARAFDNEADRCMGLYQSKMNRIVRRTRPNRLQSSLGSRFNAK